MKTKKKLLVAVCMLLVSAVMLTTASYAWFTISTAPEIQDLTTNIAVNDNLEIALATDKTTKPTTELGDSMTDWNSWGNLLDLSAVTGYSTFNFDLRPATIKNNAFIAPSYGEDGRPKAETDAIDVTAEADKYGMGNIVGEDDLVYGYYIDVWFRSNKSGDVKFSPAADRSANGTEGGGAKFTSSNEVLAKNIAIAVQDITGSTPGTITQIVTGASATKTGETWTADFGTGTPATVINLEANKEKLIRIYVYLEGESVTNGAASVSGSEKVTGTLNLQFAMAGVTDSMDKTTPST